MEAIQATASVEYIVEGINERNIFHFHFKYSMKEMIKYRNHSMAYISKKINLFVIKSEKFYTHPKYEGNVFCAVCCLGETFWANISKLNESLNEL